MANLLSFFGAIDPAIAAAGQVADSMKIGGTIHIEHWFDAVSKSVKDNTEDVLMQVAEGIRSVAMQLARVDTGAMKNSIAIVSRTKSDFSDKVRNAYLLRRDLRGVQARPYAKKDEVYIIPVVRYAGFIEFGTIHNPAWPFLTPSVEAVGKRLLPEGFKTEVFGHYKDYPKIIIDRKF